MAIRNTDRDFELNAIRRKYEEERLKRLRPDGRKQYIKMEGEFAHFANDPHTRRTERAPVEREVEVAILGGGFGALLAAARLYESGMDDVLLIEKAGDFGGVWYWNRYPGIACDTQSYVYMPLLEEVGTVPKANFASGPEILEHARKMARHYNLYNKALFQTVITGIEWDEGRAQWRVSTDRGDNIHSRFFILTTGSLHIAKLPGIPGIETFKGKCFHTSRWDFDYTGGNSFGNLTNLTDKKVGIIGTGATGVQCIPHLGEWAQHLFVFQRTPSGVDYRNEQPTDIEWFTSQEPGWQKKRIENFTTLVTGGIVEEDLVDDHWTKVMFAATRGLNRQMDLGEFARQFELIDFEIMEGVRARVDEVVKDKATAEALKPWYKRLCKRPCFHDGYLQTFNLPNVTLVDTAGKGVERITENGVVLAGREYKLDCLIFATGFERAAFTEEPIISAVGRNGVALAEKWKDGATTLHGIHVHGFPNMYILSTIQSALGPSFPHMMDEQAIHIAHIISEVIKRGAITAEVTASAESDWVAYHEERVEKYLNIWKDCTPGLYNNEGDMSPANVRSFAFGDGVMALIKIFEDWREQGDLAGLSLS